MLPNSDPPKGTTRAARRGASAPFPARARRRRRAALLAGAVTVLAGTALAATVLTAQAADSSAFVSGVTFPFNGVVLPSANGRHYWDASGGGLCRVDGTLESGGPFAENAATCDVQAKKPTQVAAGPLNPVGSPDAGMYYLYAADMSSKSGGPVRVTYDPTANAGDGGIVAGSGLVLGGPNAGNGFFSDAFGNYKNSSIALGPCDATIADPTCLAAYVGFARSKKIERINHVDQPSAQQSIETISKTTDKRKGVRFGVGIFNNAGGTSDLYIDELGGNGVSMLADVAHCPPSEGSPDPTVVNPPVNSLGGCAATIVGGMTTNFPQGMAVQNATGKLIDPLGQSRYIYYSDSPRNSSATVLRYNPATGFQDVVSSKIAPPGVPDLLNPGATQTAYTFILGLAVDNTTGDLFIGDDPTFAVLVNPPLAKGHIFRIAGDATLAAPADCVGTAAAPACPLPPPPAASTPSLYAYGMTAPKGGMTFVPSDDGGHFWAADHSQGLCRMDQVKARKASDGSYIADAVDGTTIGVHGYEPASCDDGLTLGSGGQTVYDDAVVPATTNQHYVFVAQNDHLSPGVIRFTYDPSGDAGRGALVPGSAVVMAPNAGLNGDKANGLAMGPCATDPFTHQKKDPNCVHSLYMGGLLDGFIRRINNPESAPSQQTVDVVAMTTEQRAGTLGKGINGSMDILNYAAGDPRMPNAPAYPTSDMYLPENQGFTVVKDVASCPTVVNGQSQVCGTTPINVGQFGFIFGSAIGADQAGNLVYAAISPGAAAGTVYQYDPSTDTSKVFATQGRMPAAGTADATVFCTTTCTRPVDPANPPGGVAAFRFAQGITTDANGNVYMTEDAFAGARGGRGHAWVSPFIPYPAAAGAPIGYRTPTLGGSCTTTVPVPALASGQTYWLTLTTRSSGQISGKWTIPVPQSAQFFLYPGNPFAGLTDPVSQGSKGGSIAKQVTSNTTSFSISTAPTSEPVGTYTFQYFNGSNAFGATTATVTYAAAADGSCGTLSGHAIG